MFSVWILIEQLEADIFSWNAFWWEDFFGSDDLTTFGKNFWKFSKIYLLTRICISFHKNYRPILSRIFTIPTRPWLRTKMNAAHIANISKPIFTWFYWLFLRQLQQRLFDSFPKLKTQLLFWEFIITLTVLKYSYRLFLVHTNSILMLGLDSCEESALSSHSVFGGQAHQLTISHKRSIFGFQKWLAWFYFRVR